MPNKDNDHESPYTTLQVTREAFLEAQKEYLRYKGIDGELPRPDYYSRIVMAGIEAVNKRSRRKV